MKVLAAVSTRCPSTLLYLPLLTALGTLSPYRAIPVGHTTQHTSLLEKFYPAGFIVARTPLSLRQGSLFIGQLSVSSMVKPEKKSNVEESKNALTGIAGGALAGAYIGGPIGAVGGAVVGGLLGAQQDEDEGQKTM